jgi:(p)ppGpp synthase/HD superfamily hydrolase
LVPEQDYDRLAKAFRYAAKLHRKQVRNGTEIAYVSHLMAVAALVMEHGGDDDQVIAALLHDAPEDCGGRRILRRIRRKFGRRVAGIVRECSDSLKRNRRKKKPWCERKTLYLSHLREASAEALLVSLADKVHNLRSILRDFRDTGDSVWDRFKPARDDVLWYYADLGRAYESRAGDLPAALLDEYRRGLEELNGVVEVDIDSLPPCQA